MPASATTIPPRPRSPSSGRRSSRSSATSTPTAPSTRPPGRSGSRCRELRSRTPIPAKPSGSSRRAGRATSRRSGASGSRSSPIEDIHWASSPLLDLIERLAERLTDTHVLLVCTARLELLELRPTWGAGKQNATTLTLTPLSPDEAAELVSSLLGEADVPEEVRDRVLAHAEGNPFFLEEMLNMLIDQGALERRNGGWASTERLADVTIPDSVHGVIAARIDLLDAAARDALLRCSVIGRSFWPVAVGVDEGVIDSLRRTGLVSDSAESAMGGMREFAFKHALTRDVVYSTLPRPERRDLHRQVAEWVQEVARDRGRRGGRARRLPLRRGASVRRRRPRGDQASRRLASHRGRRGHQPGGPGRREGSSRACSEVRRRRCPTDGARSCTRVSSTSRETSRVF